MALGGQARRPYRRAILIYLLAIVAPTLVVLFLGLQSVRRQREAVSSLTVSNLRLSAENLAGELERRSGQLAEACLRDPELAELPYPFAGTPEAARELRVRLEKIKQRHPIAQHLFIIEENAVLFPLLHTRPPLELEASLGGENPEARQRLTALIAEAENQELRGRRPDLALATYRQSYELARSDWFRALALARLARCFEKVNQPDAAQQAYRTLEGRYGNLYDPFYRPYGLVAGLELDSPERLARVYSNMVQGRWELSADQLDYFRAKLEERLRASVAHASQTEYLSHLELGRALEEGFRQNRPLREGEVNAYAFRHGKTDYQCFYTLLASGATRGALVGLAANLTWVKSQLLPQCEAALGMKPDLNVALGPAPALGAGTGGPGQGPARGTADQASKAHVSLKTLFPFWELSLAPSSAEAAESAARRGTLVFAASTGLLLVVLVLGVVLLMRDVSRQSELNRLRADFVSGVSHELKTPLTLIRLYGETLLDSEDFPAADRKSYYQIITRESERLTHLLENVLDFSRIDRGRKQYHLEEGDLAPVVTRTVGLYEHYLKRRGFSVESDLSTSLPPVRFDSEAVSQAVLNLLDNAAKYSGESKFVAIRLRPEENRVVFEVEDHGRGIPAGEREKIFEQFYRADGAAGKGGYGLGLFLVKHIMDTHRGSIEVESEVGRGSRFRLIFPCIRS